MGPRPTECSPLGQPLLEELSRNSKCKTNARKQSSNTYKLLNCVYTNIQSLVNKKSELLKLLEENDIHIVFLTETLITESHTASEYHLEGYQNPVIQFKDKGGAAIYVRNGVDFLEVNVPNKCNDAVWLSIKTDNNKTRLYGCVYRSPNSRTENNQRLLDNLNWAREKYSEILITGDFNLPSISWSTGEASGTFATEFLEKCDELDLEQQVTELTRFRHGQNPSLLDLILTDEPDLIEKIEYMPPLGKSDHIAIKFCLKNAFTIRAKPQRLNYRKIDDPKFRNILKQQNWKQMFQPQKSLLNAAHDFLDVMSSGITSCTPKSKSKEPPKAPWMTRRIQKLVRAKRTKWDKYKNNRSDQNYHDYKTALNRFTRAKNEAVRFHEMRLVENKGKNPKAYYRYLSSKSKYQNNQICMTNESDVTVTDEESCVKVLARYFSSTFTRGSSNVAEIDIPRLTTEMPEFVISEQHVLKHLKNFDISKCSGPDENPAFILKTFADELANPLSLLFTRSYSEGFLPEIFKSANVIPIHKGGARNLPKNYRPISLTSIITKVFETIYGEVLGKYLEDQQIISHTQHAYRKKKSTCSNLVDFWDDISSLADQRKRISIIYTDLRKAFDSVPHDLLLMKLESYGIRGKNLAWLRSYLSDRKQRVVINGTASEYVDVASGVPQGGVLSGTLFSLYVNDLPDVMKTCTAASCSVSLYADDAKMYAPVTNSDDVKRVQEDIDALLMWCQKWRLSMSREKCFYLQYNPVNTKNPVNPNYLIQGHVLERRSEAKDLGVIISDDLKFHKHIQKVCNATKSEIHRIRSFVTRIPHFLSNLFKAYVRPHMEYCVNVWNPVYQTDIKKLERVQNQFTRLLKLSPVMTPEQRNERLKITSHETRRSRGDLIATYKTFNDPKLFKIRPSEGTRRRPNSLETQRYNTNIRKHSFALRPIKDWNNLPEDVVLAEDLNTFKSRLDKHLTR